MPPTETGYKTEKRIQERKRTRLRSGKLVTLDGQFLTECHFHNIAGGGARIRTVTQARVPNRFWLFDDQHGSALMTEVVWHKDGDFGVRFIQDTGVLPLNDTILSALAGKYYTL
ncbi:PilZ domain-containing protein (plasmid) [Phyllobacterium sp. 628]|nr:PilZ domain-containing protein [Phyllobacterium sp. 628]